ncbi:MAG: hypothetical protein IPI65_00055 [Bacteroidetes bacterium]|nr:hypothetical protein [Bacteroidota bacterium]
MKHQKHKYFMSILHANVSYYPSILASGSGTNVPLLRILDTRKHQSAIINLRNEPNPELQKTLKEKLPCFTVAGIFNRRTNNGLISYSGLAAVDLDSVEDYDPILVMQELKKIPYIAYCGLSCRGKRLFCIIPFLCPELYRRHYTRLIRSFEDIGLPMGDNCHKTISQPRFVSYNTNETHFFNHDAKKYHLLETVRQFHQATYTPSKQFNNSKNAFQWCVEQINKQYSFTENQRHNYILHLARYCNLKGIIETETLKEILKFTEQDFTAREITKIVNHVYTAHSNSFNSFPFSK